MASILEVGPGGTKHFNTFEAAPENERDGPAQAANQKVSCAGSGRECARACWPALEDRPARPVF